ncbi:Hypothetical_protein [Hexamita inflata]|uniref:Hypothetical_protein n=1 Tax=Hexamita inflata TaxID=28002 RepID=A0AA86QP39_9EUKA|nr:Hypothetical protein HINF_LOCUS49363 [Hexamita inflata]
MISASKCKFVEKASYYQYNTENSLNRIEITLSQRISPNHHSFQLEKQICWKFGDLLPQQQNRQHRLKHLQIQTIAEKFSLTLRFSKCPAYEENYQMLGKYTHSALQSEFQVKIKFSCSSCHLSNSLPLVEWINMCKFCDWLLNCNKCAIAILQIEFKIKLQQLWCKKWYCATLVYKSKICVERKLLDGVKRNKVEMCQRVRIMT